VSAPAPTVVLAPNPSVLTGSGTNTYLCFDAGDGLCIDPGPDDERHLAAIVGAAEALGRISTVLLSHSHPDHRPLARALAARSGAVIRCLEPARADDGALPLEDGERVSTGALTLEAVATPGHAADHLCFWDADSRTLYSGDHILQGMTTVIAPPDGDMADYMDSLERVKRLRPATILPGHGARVDDAAALIDEYLVHRREREAQVLRAARERGRPVAPSELVPAIYAQYPKTLWPYAAMSVEAHLDKLVKEGHATRFAGAEGALYRVR
jgi:glyoxylase-like metal-dependent hydrolase (beta-lactamase superfamily II)